MAIKKLQKDFTTPEQSKRLLELGVPADSANYAYYPLYVENLYGNGKNGFMTSGTPKILKDGETFSTMRLYGSGLRELCVPCWSVGRLMEIFDTCKTEYTDCYRDWIEDTDCNNYVEFLVGVFGRCVYTFDFSKLEE